ncbi:hypothetical protein CALVIDRAFT_531124 [Calocera viscosa TUFC12733]|uniref:Uncharacterized protein n=1 Tax=Calocera viscosa (strain TUFC12733) TaxID=1330018 RepID=A0A167GUR9_CALVF|nr:hypothetical protein CALVIDRAFT_531124 [Calocera viscosa TUFC12733]
MTFSTWESGLRNAPRLPEFDIKVKEDECYFPHAAKVANPKYQFYTNYGGQHHLTLYQQERQYASRYQDQPSLLKRAADGSQRRWSVEQLGNAIIPGATEHWDKLNDNERRNAWTAFRERFDKYYRGEGIDEVPVQPQDYIKCAWARSRDEPTVYARKYDHTRPHLPYCEGPPPEPECAIVWWAPCMRDTCTPYILPEDRILAPLEELVKMPDFSTLKYQQLEAIYRGGVPVCMNPWWAQTLVEAHNTYFKTAYEALDALPDDHSLKSLRVHKLNTPSPTIIGGVLVQANRNPHYHQREAVRNLDIEGRGMQQLLDHHQQRREHQEQQQQQQQQQEHRQQEQEMPPPPLPQHRQQQQQQQQGTYSPQYTGMDVDDFSTFCPEPSPFPRPAPVGETWHRHLGLPDPNQAPLSPTWSPRRKPTTSDSREVSREASLPPYMLNRSSLEPLFRQETPMPSSSKRPHEEGDNERERSRRRYSPRALSPTPDFFPPPPPLRTSVEPLFRPETPLRSPSPAPPPAFPPPQPTRKIAFSNKQQRSELVAKLRAQQAKKETDGQ